MTSHEEVWSLARLLILSSAKEHSALLSIFAVLTIVGPHRRSRKVSIVLPTTSPYNRQSNHLSGIFCSSSSESPARNCMS
jgi:hypothetical protein